MTSRRYTVTDNDDNACTLRLRDGTEVRYWAPMSGGYVRDVTDAPGTLGRQVCDGLQGMGSTLRWSGRGRLIGLIRAEARTAAGSRAIDAMIEAADLVAWVRADIASGVRCDLAPGYDSRYADDDAAMAEACLERGR